ncbi:MAG: sensor histidine kinase [Zetaproteobacteria bacterium CG12_big_fil_rev_8_21_14_0_65_54_13]|nr:MAG: sensor histidine kinase [Zetaproteobacteria bacterium CG12_big_fil_rev_8_21_14_0_65_54_13]PIX53855.1 MAG: sensor histidine kinase [Zetaproteobacteria bacterium CG_4_10_14_3_um_filter_54_28]PJA30803.1 MAG: sensor histidine kinase [Zetaproteobacteria bacterium CG_4_9_14_3_um_filter_54_145]
MGCGLQIQRTVMIIRTLYARLGLTLALTLGLVGLMYALFIFTTVQKNSQHADQSLNRDLARTLVADRNLVRENELDEKALKETFRLYMDLNPSIEIYLLDLSGKILAYSADPERVRRSYVDLKPIYTFLKKDAMFPILGDDPRATDRQKVFSVTPIPSAANANGYLYVILRGEQYDRVEQFARDKALLSLTAWVITIALSISLLVGLLVFYPLTRRLRRLSEQVDTFRQSDFSTLPEISATSGEDELNQLESNISLMAKQITSQLQHISQQDAQRRDLFASLSHDLRTPLATVNGYLETLQIKHDELPDETRKAYLARAIQFSNRLKALVDELFEMAKLEAIDAAPHNEPFSLPELIQDILQQFEVQAQQTGVRLQLQGDMELAFVDGDIGLIQRVFENLVANALRFSSHGDQIAIRLLARDDQVEVEVSDTGCGIDRRELNKIFEPLYQVGNAHRGGEHSGLGLTIVKRILQLHDSDIRASSETGRGTTFTFALKTAR